MITLLLTVLASTAQPDRVVVFTDRAHVTRVTTIGCRAPSTTTFTDLPPSAVLDSFRARVDRGVVTAVRPEPVTRESRDADAERLRSLQHDAAALRDQVAVAEAKARAAERYHAISLELIAKDLAGAPDLKGWQTALDASLKASLEANATLAQLAASQRALKLQLDEATQQVERRRAEGERHGWSVEVLASCTGAATAELSLTYEVRGASWTPAYEARADEARHVVVLQRWATITQHTGEAWPHVELVLSNADPVPNATPPTRNKLMVVGFEQPAERRVLVRRQESARHAETGTAPGAFDLSVQLTLPGASTVPADASPVRVLVGTTTLAAQFELRAVPRLAPVAFRVAEVTNETGRALLPGELDAFRGNTLAGRYELERVAAGAPFTLSFGPDETLRVKRVTLEELHLARGVFRHRFSFAYRFQLRNAGREALDVSLSDHLPVSELQDVQVTVAEKTTAGYQLRPDDGIARWRLSLTPGETRVVELAFVVEVPASYDIGQLTPVASAALQR